MVLSSFIAQPRIWTKMFLFFCGTWRPDPNFHWKKTNVPFEKLIPHLYDIRWNFWSPGAMQSPFTAGSPISIFQHCQITWRPLPRFPVMSSFNKLSHYRHHHHFHHYNLACIIIFTMTRLKSCFPVVSSLQSSQLYLHCSMLTLSISFLIATMMMMIYI